MAMLSLDYFIDNYIYFYHLGESGEYMILPTYPTTIADSMGSTFNQTNALSRSAPVFSYSYSGPRTVQIQLALHSDMMEDLNMSNSSIKKDLLDVIQNNDYVDILKNKLQAITLPKYSASSKSVQPPMIAVRFGNEIFIKGVVAGDISVSYGLPILSNKKYAQVTISFTVSEIDPFDANSVAKDGSFRGITRAFKTGIKDENTGIWESV